MVQKIFLKSFNCNRKKSIVSEITNHYLILSSVSHENESWKRGVNSKIQYAISSKRSLATSDFCGGAWALKLSPGVFATITFFIRVSHSHLKNENEEWEWRSFYHRYTCLIMHSSFSPHSSLWKCNNEDGNNIMHRFLKFMRPSRKKTAQLGKSNFC